MQDIAEKHSDKNEDLVFVPAKKGFKYSKEIMFVGRAVNGWDKDSHFTPSEIKKDSKREKLIDKLVKADPNECPTRWVSRDWGRESGGYRPARSAFWRLARDLIEEFHISDINSEKWASHFVYSNLYKVAPDCANPNSSLMDIQRKHAIDILKEEIKLYKPKRIVMMTGYNWAKPFLDAIGFQSQFKDSNAYDYVEDVGKVQSKYLLVISKHPQGKKGADFKCEVVKAFESMGT